MTEKPLAAADANGPPRLAAAIEKAGLVVAVGYHLRALDILSEIRDRLGEAPPRLVVARWLDSTPGPTWWGRAAEGGGQVIEQATHLYDLARLILGEATVVGAASTRDLLGSPRGVDVTDSTATVLRFANGAVGSFDSSLVLSTYADALKTDRLTRAVVAATGAPG